MTEQEIEQARADLEQLDIEQLRCGVLLQLMHIERLKAERDDAWLQNTALDARCAKLEAERDALMAAAKLALDALDEAQTYADNVGKALDEAQKYAYNVGKYMHGVPQAIETLKQAGVQ